MHNLALRFVILQNKESGPVDIESGTESGPVVQGDRRKFILYYSNVFEEVVKKNELIWMGN